VDTFAYDDARRSSDNVWYFRDMISGKSEATDNGN